MKISFKKSVLPSDESITLKLGENFLSISDSKFVINLKEGSKQFFFEGELYYSIIDGKYSQIRKNECSEFLKRRLNKFDVVEFINSVEGIYNCVYVDEEKKSLIIFCDYLNRKNFFYTKKGGEIYFSTSLNSIIPEISEVEYNQDSLQSYLTLGYTPIDKTFYKGINRFKSNEFIEIVEGKIEHKIFPEEQKIENYDDSHLAKYDELLSNSIISRSSLHNIVLNSGGWDSTSIIYHLTKSYPSEKINSLVYETKLSDGQIFNVYESNKVKRISEFYSVKSDICEVDFNNKNLLNDWESVKAEMKNYHTYFFVDMPKVVAHAVNNGAEDISIFSGEASDSIHNFGFSQFVSVNYGNKQLREYADKMKSYLFGPTFFLKIKNNTYKEDKVFQFFKFYFSEENFEKFEDANSEEALISYLISFMLSPQRVPFSKVADRKFTDGIFSSIASKISRENLYYFLIQLYRAYHFHSSQIEVKHTPLRKFGANCKIPFLDSSLVKYMYSMPENWGRGLELRPTKYPLRKLAKEKWNMPNQILEESGPHSYISESDKRWNYSGGNWNIYCETIYKSVFTDYFKSVLYEIDIEKYFNPEFFDIVQMKNVIKDFINGKEDNKHAAFIYKLGLLFSIGLY